eukprot:TRINITY_DN203_c1_g7_i1.p1 TRINITY_DN203_c1_g7~~TRINITY_DN203_c1_g7_i1.p1  ORF type:complete len:331 (+),score=106.39 TRINITY_DN203_c1_g7_i1:28-1020(+)
MANLDDLLGELDDGAPDYSDSLSDSDDLPSRKKYSSSSDEDSESDSEDETVFDVEDLDDLIGELEEQDKNGEIRAQAPRVKGLKANAPRKTTKRKIVKGVLDGDDLDRILDEIDDAAREKVKGDTSKLGFGVINAERKFDLRAPQAVAINSNVEATLIVSTQSGEKSRIPMKLMKIELLSDYDLAHTVSDNKDGTYTIKFKPTKVGVVTLQIDGYGKRQFDWEVTVAPLAHPAHCTAVAPSRMTVKSECVVIITSRDETGKQLEIGGADFSLSFHGVGQLDDVGLMDQGDGTYKLIFTPDTLGEYAVFISLDGKEIKDYPFKFEALPKQV